jgi:hypothetical protein
MRSVDECNADNAFNLPQTKSPEKSLKRGKTAKFGISAISAIKHGIPRFISISAKNRGITESRKTGVLNDADVVFFSAYQVCGPQNK